MRKLARLILPFVVATVGLGAAPAEAKIPRSSSAKAEFKRQHPCPSTGKPRGACHGYIIDHVIPLCAGGPDEPANMQWQTVADAKEKDKDERRMCRSRTGAR